MIIELEKEPKVNQFYWFTAKIRPRVVDVVYTSKDIHYYGFKTAPEYMTIEFSDLRFITHATLDDVIEEFR